jgi:hypothetical protein
LKCTCGFERVPGSVLCRMQGSTDGRFLVEIFGPDDGLMAQSNEALEMKKALEFVESMVDRRRVGTHYHWEEGRTKCESRREDASTFAKATADRGAKAKG